MNSTFRTRRLRTTAVKLIRPSLDEAQLWVVRIHHEILAGFPVKQVRTLAVKLGMREEELAKRIGVSRSTYIRKLKARMSLGQIESDVLARYQRLSEQATETFGGDEGAARQWLSHPQPGLGGAVPLEFARTNVGAREVEKLLTRIDLGVYS